MDQDLYDEQLRKLQTELCLLQQWIKDNKKRIVIVFEGRDTAGKGGVIRTIRERVHSRLFSVEVVDHNEQDEFFQRYEKRIPLRRPEHTEPEGKVVIFDRSWYNKCGVEYVMNFPPQKTQEQLNEMRAKFFEDCRAFEKKLSDDGIHLIKIWLDISQTEQMRRIRARIEDPLRQWKLSTTDSVAPSKWDEYTQARDVMLAEPTDVPWICVDSDDKRRARLNVIAYILSQFPYEFSDEKVIEILMKLETDQLPAMVLPAAAATKPNCLDRNFYRGVEIRNQAQKGACRDAIALQLRALQSFKEGDMQMTERLLNESILACKATQTKVAILIELDGLTDEEKKSFQQPIRKYVNPNDGYLISTGLGGALLLLQSRGLFRREPNGNFTMTEEYEQVIKEHPEQLGIDIQDAEHAVDRWRRSKLSRKFVKADGQGIFPTVGWPLLSGTHLAYKNGILGTGINVAIVGNSVWNEHPDLSGMRIISIGRETSFDEHDEADTLSKGTALASIVASRELGLAPNTSLILVNIKVGDEEIAFSNGILEAADLADSLGEKLIVMWPNGPQELNVEYLGLLTQFFIQLEERGVLVVSGLSPQSHTTNSFEAFRRHTLLVGAIGWSLAGR